MASERPFDAYAPTAPLHEATLNRAWLYVLVLVSAAGFYAWEARYLYLDDAFIHLRIAKNLLEHGFYSFNGDHPTFCTSSPLFTALLAVCSQVISSPGLPKFIGLVIYAALFVMIASRALAATMPPARWLWIAFLTAVASPMAMRWLADGMETGLSGIFALILARAAFDIYSRSKPARPVTLIAYAAFGLLASTLRIEFSLLVALICTAESTRFLLRREADRCAIALALGSLAGLAVIYLVFGRILPDTAIAKAHGFAGMSGGAALLDTLADVAKAHLAASTLGILVPGGTVLSFWMAMRTARHRAFVAVLNAGLVLLLCLVVWRGQAIQGYRYFVFIEFFLLAFNIAAVNSREQTGEKRFPPLRPWIASPATAVLLALVFVGWQAFDLHKLRTISAGRGVSFEKFESADLAGLRGTFGIAWDVGMIGYFSQATILDGNGLVNGVDVARMTRAERLHLFATRYPVRFAFVNAAQLAILNEYLDVSRWEVRQTYEFPNFSGDPDRHFLLVRQD